MKRYHFRLEQVLRVRRTQEELERAALLAANQEFRVRTGREAVALERHGLRLVAGATTPEPTAALLRRRFLEESSARSVTLARAAVHEAGLNAAARRQAWAEAARRVAILERLDERRRAEHAAEAARQEALEVDDLVVSRFGRSR
jgi:flagellar export protein FliJ